MCFWLHFKSSCWLSISLTSNTCSLPRPIDQIQGRLGQVLPYIQTHGVIFSPPPITGLSSFSEMEVQSCPPHWRFSLSFKPWLSTHKIRFRGTKSATQQKDIGPFPGPHHCLAISLNKCWTWCPSRVLSILWSYSLLRASWKLPLTMNHEMVAEFQIQVVW